MMVWNGEIPARLAVGLRIGLTDLRLTNWGEGSRLVKLNCPLEEQRKPGPLSELLSHPEEEVCFRTRQYTHLARKIDLSRGPPPRERKGKTGWRWTQSRANSSMPEFPANREKYREFCTSGGASRWLSPFRSVVSRQKLHSSDDS